MLNKEIYTEVIDRYSSAGVVAIVNDKPAECERAACGKCSRLVRGICTDKPLIEWLEAEAKTKVEYRTGDNVEIFDGNGWRKAEYLAYYKGKHFVVRKGGDYILTFAVDAREIRKART